jgi:hypothetical protein
MICHDNPAPCWGFRRLEYDPASSRGPESAIKSRIGTQSAGITRGRRFSLGHARAPGLDPFSRTLSLHTTQVRVMSLVPSNDQADFVLAPAENPQLPLLDDAGHTIGHVELRVCLPEKPVSHPEIEQLHKELLQLRNIVSRMQAQLRMIEQRGSRH